MSIDKSEVAVLKLLGERMTEARKLCQITQQEAANRLGITPEFLKRIEDCIDVGHVPVKVIRQASLIFDVSCDYLLAFSTDWECCEEVKLGREIGAWIHQQQIKMFAKWSVRQMQLEHQVEAMTAAVGVLPAEIEAIVEALTAFKGMNPNFDKLPASSQLQYHINKASEKAKEARRALIRSQVAG